MRKLRPTSDRILIRTAAAPQKTGGLSVPKSQEEEPNEGVVVAAGPKALKFYQHPAPGVNKMVNPEGVAVGETVLFQRYAGRKVESGGEKLRLIRLDEVDCTVEDGE